MAEQGIMDRASIAWLRFRAWLRECIYALRVRLFGRLAIEAATEGRSALAAVADDSIEGDAQVAAQRAAWSQQVTYLTDLLDRDTSLPQHTRLDYERLVRQLRRNIRDLDAAEARRHATPETLGDQRLVTFGAVGQARTPVQGFLGPLAPAGLAVGMVRPWMLWTGAIAAVGVWGAYNDVRAGRLENERNEARATIGSLEREVMATSAERDMLRDAAVQADAQSQQAAQTIEAERARRLRAEREARRIRDAMEQARAGGPVEYGFGGVRDTESNN